MAIREIITIGHPTLRQKARKVAKFGPEVKQLIDDMVDEEHAFEVIDFVLEDARQVVVGADALRLAVGILPAHHDPDVAVHLADIAGDRKATLFSLFDLA